MGEIAVHQPPAQVVHIRDPLVLALPPDEMEKSIERNSPLEMKM
jgi:hypothetical protein